MNSRGRISEALTVIRTVLGGSAIAIGFGAAVAMTCLVLGLVLRGVLEIVQALARGAWALAEVAWALGR